MPLKINVLGGWASYNLPKKYGRHFSLLLDTGKHKIWIDPAVSLKEGVDAIIVTQSDEDHYIKLDSYLEKHPDVPVYSTRAVINKINISHRKNLKAVRKPLKFDGLEIIFMAVPHKVNVPAVALKIRYRGHVIGIVPEFNFLGEQEIEYLKNAVLIAGVGEYEKRKPNDTKATFKELIEYANGELSPKRLYLTNLRKATFDKHKRDILKELKKFNGGILLDGASLTFNGDEVKTEGLYLVSPHATLIYEGFKTMILKSRKFDMAGKKFILCDDTYAYGTIELNEPEEINEAQFEEYADEHLVTKEEMKKWGWAFPLYAYRIKDFIPYEEPIELSLPKGIQTFVRDVEQYFEKLHLQEFRSTGVDYDIKHINERWREAIADLRYLGNSGYPRLKRGEKWGDWTLEDVLKYFAKLVDALRSVYFPVIPPYNEKLYREYTRKDPKKAKKSSYWKCYREAEKYMKSKPPKNIAEAKEWDKKRRQKISLRKKARSLKIGYYSEAKPYYRGYFQELADELKAIGWDEERILVDCKWDGLRMTIGKVNGKGFAYVDPDDVKEKNPNVSNRIPAIIKEIEENFPDNTILDGEFLAVHPNGKEMLHRTVANSLLNSKASGEELERYAIIVAFDVIFYDGLDLRDQPLHERLEYLSRLKPTKHIWIERISTSLDKKADGYICNGSDIDCIMKAADIIASGKNGRPKFCAEGVMLKRLDGPYEYPQNHYWMKVKFYHELDLRVINKKLVKGSKDVYNYYLGYDTPREYAEAYLSMTTKDWYGKVHCFKNGKIIAAGKDCKKFLNDNNVLFVTLMGKTDNHKEVLPIKIGDIIRIAAEEVLKFENSKFPEYPRYSFYIGRVLEPIPEKDITDSLETIDKLSSFEPQRIPIEELQHITQDIAKMGDVYVRIIRFHQ